VRREELAAWRHEVVLWTLRAPYVPKAERPPDPPEWMVDWRTPEVIRG